MAHQFLWEYGIRWLPVDPFEVISRQKNWRLKYDELETAFSKGIDIVTEESLADPTERERSPWFIRNIMRERVSIYEKQ
ncbi:MAG: hypothetical protein LBB94_06790 [Clostridiales bacterium]|jgi:hypothetical protein|nr:hypothetical protein [Clostridiales bacterium]